MKRILVIEDDHAVAELVVEILEDAGHDVDWTSSADEGLQRVRAAQPDLVLLDLTLPGMNGLSFLEICKDDATLAGLPIVTMSGTAMTGAEAEPMPDATIRKPFDVDDLCSVVSRFVGDHVALANEASR